MQDVQTFGPLPVPRRRALEVGPSAVRATTAVDPAALWAELRLGRLKIVHSGCGPDRCHLELALAPGGRGAPRHPDLLEHILLGRSQKQIALEEKRSPSTIAMKAQRSLHALGLDCEVGKVPVLLLMIVHAAHLGVPLPGARLATSERADGHVRVLGADRPDLELPARLSRCERQVLNAVIEGKPYQEIAVSRSTSVRTTANQIASAYGKLGVTGRMNLVGYLLAPPAEPAPDSGPH